jgi:beta-glucosidase
MKNRIPFTIVFITLLFVHIPTESQKFATDKQGLKIYHKDWIDFNKNGEKDIYEDPHQGITARIDDLLTQMNLDEKTCQMATWYGYNRVLKDQLPTAEWKNKVVKDGIGNIDEHINAVAYHGNTVTHYSWPPSNHARAVNEVQRFFVEETRMGIPVDFTNEGIRGLCHQGATGFPAQIGIGSTWDKELVSAIGKVVATEARILGYTNIYSPILDLARDPRWGRTVECYSEDPYLVSSLGLEMVKAMQANGVASTGKHFAVYSSPKGGRDGGARTDPQVTERAMHEIFLEPFRTAVEEGHILGLMSSYNDYNGIPITGSHYFLSELLRDKWGFKGYVVSDSWAVGGLEGRHYVAENYKEAVYQSVEAGLNIRTNFTPPEDFILPLRELVNEKRISESTVNSRVRDILRVKFMLGLFDDPYVDSPEKADTVVHNLEHVKVAKRASHESIVLLKNDVNLLPLNKDALGSILITGPNAKAVNHSISRYGPSNIDVISLYEGIKNLVGEQLNLEFAHGCDFYDENWPLNELYDIEPSDQQKAYINEAVEKAKNVDVIIVAVGDDEHTVGESRSRTSLNLPGNQQDLVEALYKTGKPVVVVLINGRPMTVNWIDAYIPSIIEAWFPGEYGGEALADVLFGNYNPGGKLPITFPRTVGQIPFNFPAKRSSQKWQGRDEIGSTRINSALYPFGYGLSYTTFEYSDLQISPVSETTDFDSVSISFTLKNSGQHAGIEIPQLYIQDEYSSVVWYEKLLQGYTRVSLEPGESKRVTFNIHPKNLSLLNRDMKRVVEPGKFNIYIGSSSEDIRLEGNLMIN